MKKALLIINPSSGGEKAKEYQQLAQEKLNQSFDEVKICQTEQKGDAKSFAKKAANEKYDSVFVMGGDGTVNEGISGLAEEKYRPKFGFFPLGTVNDLARALDIPLDPKKAIANFSITKTTPLDIGKINDSYFMNVVAIGAIPEAINNVDSEQKTKFGKLTYFISGFKELSNNETYSFLVTIDGKKQEITSSTLLIGSTNSIGGFESLLPEAKVDDGKLHLIYLKDPSLIDTIKSVPDLLKGVAKATENVGYLAFDQAVISLENSDKKLVTNVDGDEGDILPVTITVLPAHLEVYH
ncbi:hypothetical protein IGI65_001202 [Enterococcus sp. DIV0755b]|uniref:diacylglycerol/lipid kinase family protein n=1 Tax=Enterococcus sp. DIV0755b TaxID=2774657 RepID=UPI003F220B37